MKKLFICLACLLTCHAIFAGPKVIALRNNAPLKKEDPHGLLFNDRNIPNGTELELFDERVRERDADDHGRIIRGVRVYKVKYAGREYFIDVNEVVKYAPTARLVEDARLYRNGDFRAHDDILLRNGTTVALTGERKNSEGRRFSEIQFYDARERRVRTRWINDSHIKVEVAHNDGPRYNDRPESRRDEARSQPRKEEQKKRSGISVNISL